MSQVPLFSAYINGDNNCHLSVGIEPKTLCRHSRINSTFQIESIDEIQGNDNINQLCEDCEEKWEQISDNVTIEPTVDCHRCRTPYGISISRSVEHMSDGQVNVCKVCYEEMYNDDNSHITIPYEDADPYMENDGSREYKE